MIRTSREPSQLEERIDRIVTLATTYPDAATRVALQFVADEQKQAYFALFCEAIGIECARLIFDSLPDFAWKLIDASGFAPVPVGIALETFSRELLLECMGEPEAIGSRPGENPFHFLIKLPRHRLTQLLSPYPIEKIALIGAFMKRGEIAAIAHALGPQGAKRLLVAVSRLHRIPRTALVKQALPFADELEERVNSADRPKTASAIDEAIAGIDLDGEKKILAQLAGHGHELDELIQSIPSSESIRSIIESARQKISI